MDKLTLTFLLLVLLTGYTSSLILILSMLMIVGIVDITHLTLFFMTLLGVYNIYGLQGLCVLLLSTLSFIGSGYMYITNVSFSDMIKTVNNTENNYEVLLTNVYHKTGIKKESIQYIYNSYNNISLKYDLFCKFVYIHLCNLRYITEDIAGFKYLYDLYDRCMSIKQHITQFQQLFNMSSSFTIPENIVSIANDTINDELKQEKNDITISEIDDDELDIDINDELEKKSNNKIIKECNPSLPKNIPVVNDQFASLFGNSNNLDFNNIMAMNKQMEKQLSNMPPEQKQQLDKMAMDMMSGLFGNINKRQ